MLYFIVWIGVVYKPDLRCVRMIRYARVDSIVGGSIKSIAYVHFKSGLAAAMGVFGP